MEERLTIEEMNKKYWGKWVVLKDVEKKWADIVSAVVVDVLEPDQRDMYEVENLGKYDYLYIGENTKVGDLHVEGVRFTIS